ncbi:unnamed protein product [Bemisia tabaci]|uniref:Ionotropic receptor n=1 Tax=Bemisia tabaci TaxID=7038 RepID=A0A9P0FA31_BEMTA|nr:unnamed protein product [Bemisia tabaci]
MGLKYDAALFAVESTVRVDQDLEVFEASAPIEACHVVIRVPRQKFIPQYVAVFRCFSTVLWICVIVTVCVFTLVHIICVKIERESFVLLYPEQELHDQEYRSTLLAIVRYILGIGQPRIVLVESTTGKIVFFIFVFSILILSTLFQSGMVTLLSTRIRYEEIDTLKGIEESDLVVESPDIGLDMEFLGEEPQFDWLKQKLTDSLKIRCENRYCGVESDFAFYHTNESVSDWNDFYDREIYTILETRGYLTRTTSIVSRFNNRVYYDRRTGDMHEFHDVSEYVMSYPLLYFVERKSFFREVFNDVLTRLLEAGVFYRSTIRLHTELKENFAFAEKTGDTGEPRPYSMTDLKIAFICLCVVALFGVIKYYNMLRVGITWKKAEMIEL